MSNSMFSIARAIKKIYFFEMKIIGLNEVLNEVVKKYLKMSASDDVLHFRKKIESYYSDIRLIKNELIYNYKNNLVVRSDNHSLEMKNHEGFNLDSIDKNVDKLSRELQLYLMNKI